jgi:hypothetical protein
LEVPVRGWKDVLFRVWKNIGKDRLLLVGAGVTFYIILALFPAIAALVALYGVFADPTTISSHLDAAPYARAASHCLAAAEGAGLTDALLAREAAGSAAAPGRRPGSSREMQVCRTFGRNHLLRSVL